MRGLKTLLVIFFAVAASLVLIFFINEHDNKNKEPNIPQVTTESKTTITSEQHTKQTISVTPTQPASPTTNKQTNNTENNNTEENKEPVDYSIIRPDESGEIPIVMFHNFIEDLNNTNDNYWTTSYDEFEKLLETLYNNNFRLISMRDFIDHNISVPAGKFPMVFTFDDGTRGQYNLIEVDGKLEVNPKSAVGLMLKFHEKHPEFGLKGVFYLNMDKENKTFEGAGSLKERLDILLGYGFEVGNHSWGHVKFEELKEKAEINERLGKNQKYLEGIIDGLKFYSLALPHGIKAPEALTDDMVSGKYEGVQYINETIMAVGFLPSVPSIHTEYNPSYVRRIRSQGKVEEKYDLTYWLPLMTRDRMYISDGNPDLVVVPENKVNYINTDKLNGKKLVTYRLK
jgi:peptidoglycan/xylan/chitin deacetylase (PgdA/CDA1 family)